MLSKNTIRWHIISLSCGLYWLASSSTRSIITLYADRQGAAEMEIGILLGIYALFPFVIAIPIGGLVNTTNKVFLLKIGSWLMIGSGIIYYVSTNFWVLLLAQTVAGVGQLFVWLIIQVMITEGKNQKATHSRIATFSLFMAVGQLLGPLLGGFLSDAFGYKSSFMMYTFVCMVLTVISYFLKEEMTTVNAKPITSPSLVKMYKTSGNLFKNLGFVAAMLFSFIVLFIIDARMSFVPLYMKNHLEYSNTSIGLLLSVASLSALLVKPIYPFLVTRYGYYKLLIGSFLFSLLLLYLTPFHHTYFSMVLLIFVSGLALSINQPLSLSMVSEQTEEDERGIAFGLRLMANRGAQLLDPLLFGVVSSILSLKLAFWSMGLLLSVLSFFSIMMYSLAAKKGAKEKQVSSVMS